MSKSVIESGKAVLGIEFGSTRIKAVLVDDANKPIASGSHEWENQLKDGIWTYSIDMIWEGQGVTAAKQKLVGLGTGGRQSDLLKGSVILNKAGMLPAGDGGGFRSQGAVDVAEVFLIQKGAAAALQRKADIFSVHCHRPPETLTQGSRKLLIPPDRVLIQDHFPSDAAAMGTSSRQAEKRIKIIRNTHPHGNPS